MKVLLLEDVYKLGRAGDIKKVANGYGRNYLIPQGLAVLATSGALKQVEHIRSTASTRRVARNEEMGGLAEQLSGLEESPIWPDQRRAGETGKLYGSVTTQMIADSLKEETGVEIDRRQIDAQPIRMIGEHKVGVRLTIDLIPVITIVVFQEGEAAEVVLEHEKIAVQEEEAEAEPETSEPVAKVEVEKEQRIEVELEQEPTAEFEPEQEEENETVAETADKE